MRKSIVLAGATYGLTTNDNFSILRCNNELTKEPELTFSINPTYFNSHLSWLLDQACFSFLSRNSACYRESAGNRLTAFQLDREILKSLLALLMGAMSKQLPRINLQ